MIDGFDPELLQAMGQAYDEVLRSLQDMGQPPIVREVIAARIVNLAQAGERDPGQLYAGALEWFGPRRQQAA